MKDSLKRQQRMRRERKKRTNVLRAGAGGL